ncbi:MAG: hypothetical protein WBM57_11440 [Woeseiaceae bacterium]
MSELYWIILGGLLMAAIAMVGSITLVLKPAALNRLLLVLVAFAAGWPLQARFSSISDWESPPGSRRPHTKCRRNSETSAYWFTGGWSGAGR